MFSIVKYDFISDKKGCNCASTISNLNPLSLSILTKEDEPVFGGNRNIIFLYRNSIF
jgi:hypothetical protein